MLNPYWNSIPPEVQGNLIPSSFTEYQWGTLLLSVCFLQIVLPVGVVLVTLDGGDISGSRTGRCGDWLLAS